MYLQVDPQKSCARAWVAAALKVSPSGEAFNVVIDVEDPNAFDEKDNQVINLVDRFLRGHSVGPISTVANTLFPQSLYRKHGSPQFYGEYLNTYKRLTKSKNWGRYFLRMTRRMTEGNKKTKVEKLDDSKTYNPLQDLIDKMRDHKAKNKCVRAMHEIAIYDPMFDRKHYSRGGPCLSLLSFKRHPEHGLLLTAVYRNHSYITRCLGNLIGLGRLQAFVAKEVGIPVGSLTCISTHAELDTGKEDGKKWTLTEARTLVSNAAALLSAPLLESPIAAPAIH
jgi:thymidylate synthase